MGMEILEIQHRDLGFPMGRIISMTSPPRRTYPLFFCLWSQQFNFPMISKQDNIAATRELWIDINVPSCTSRPNNKKTTRKRRAVYLPDSNLSSRPASVWCKLRGTFARADAT